MLLLHLSLLTSQTVSFQQLLLIIIIAPRLTVDITLMFLLPSHRCTVGAAAFTALLLMMSAVSAVSAADSVSITALLLLLLLVLALVAFPLALTTNATTRITNRKAHP